MSVFTVRKRLGRCYELAGKAVLFEPFFPDTAVLVHGVLTSPVPGTPYTTVDHAWVEFDGRIWDPTLNRIYPRSDYIAKFDAVELERYSKAEAGLQMLAAGHWGYWADDAARAAKAAA